MQSNMKQTHLRVMPAEGAYLVEQLGGVRAVMRGLGLSPNTVRKFKTAGATGAQAAALRMAYAWKLEGMAWEQLAQTTFGPPIAQAAE